ncbi:MAG: septum formation initiator family protein [Clostridiales bacterium]|nr:septum formation initiator family protein [Clostridiales bacterium]
MKQDKKKKRRAPITLVVLVVLVAVVSVELLRVYGQLDSAKTQRDTMGQQLEEQKKENSDLESDLGKANDKEFIKGLAKDQLGLAEDGERIFYDVNH